MKRNQFIDETVKNIREALELHIEGEDLNELGFYPEAPIVITLELEPVHA